MRRLVVALSMMAALSCGPNALADVGAWQVGAGLGYAFPVGALERGSRTSDVTFGVPFAAIDGAYRLHRFASLGAGFSYGILIPTLCATASDCFASIGHDVVASVLARVHLGEWGRFEPSVDAAFGYEWMTASLSDEGTAAERAYRGFEGALAVDGLLRLSHRVALGGRLELRGGSFQRVALTAPGVTMSGSTEGSLVHFWPMVAVRSVVSF